MLCMLTAVFAKPCQDFVDEYFNDFYDILLMTIITPTICVHLNVCEKDQESGEQVSNSRIRKLRK